ncbi:hypothetical protein [Clostridium tarantellae]|uniref:Transposase n=1 Tax=Clostridium tarantellae TaxID=39493 RepID=A0A6I1MLK8_9CLOT|nr:hypothetical protein [Clostridium tarantellae]MPQ43298.1 hypothetical protein [Clostridium tarantellae]
MTNFFHKIREISGESIFIDGTKIEAYANKYKNDLFVCQNGKKLKMEGIKLKKSKTGYVS